MLRSKSNKVDQVVAEEDLEEVITSQPQSLSNSEESAIESITSIDAVHALLDFHNLDQLVIKKDTSVTKVDDKIIKFNVFKRNGDLVYKCQEKSNNWGFGPWRQVTLTLLDDIGNELIQFDKPPFRCTSCCFPCWLQKMRVSAPVGFSIGEIIQKWYLHQQ
jgi:hypothetical protein